jgi:hypothetical protein
MELFCKALKGSTVRLFASHRFNILHGLCWDRSQAQEALWLTARPVSSLMWPWASASQPQQGSAPSVSQSRRQQRLSLSIAEAAWLSAAWESAAVNTVSLLLRARPQLWLGFVTANWPQASSKAPCSQHSLCSACQHLHL